MRAGRPIRSDIRQNIVEILKYGKSYGYQIYKVYVQIYPKVTLRSIYYHLKKGQETGEINLVGKEKRVGDFSWGGEANYTYYSLGQNATPNNDPLVKKYFESKKSEQVQN